MISEGYKTNFIKPKLQNYKDNESSNHYSDDNESSSDWLKEAAGTDDSETMRDVYWNID